MVNFIPLPTLQELLPPFLAHLPTAFTSSQPPPSLYPLLSPILRQRVRLLSSTSAPNPSPEETWLSLLAWSATVGPKLSSHLADRDFTPHPSSGELEVGETTFRGIQRVDRETLKASVELSEFDIGVIYTWCTNDPDGEDDGWKIMDVNLLSPKAEETNWYPTVGEADAAFYRGIPEISMIETLRRESLQQGSRPDFPPPAQEQDEDDDYWNSYDRTPARSPAVPQKIDQPSEDVYFSQYSNVQPVCEPEQSSSTPTMNSVSLASQISTYSPPTTATSASTPPTALSSSYTTHAPRPISVASTGSSTKARIAKLEEHAELQVASEVAIKQHVSTSIKSLFRLSRSAGIGREEFERILQTEIAMLGMMEENEEGFKSGGEDPW